MEKIKVTKGQVLHKRGDEVRLLEIVLSGGLLMTDGHDVEVRLGSGAVAGAIYSPGDEYDFDYSKGFCLYDKYYKGDMIDEERRNAEWDRDYHYDDSDWKWTLNVKCIPLLVYKEEQVGYIAPDGTKKYFKKEEKEYKKKWKKEAREIKKLRKTIKTNGEEYYEM